MFVSEFVWVILAPSIEAKPTEPSASLKAIPFTVTFPVLVIVVVPFPTIALTDFPLTFIVPLFVTVPASEKIPVVFSAVVSILPFVVKVPLLYAPILLFPVTFISLAVSDVNVPVL